MQIFDFAISSVLHSKKIIKGHWFISHRVDAMILQLRQVFSICLEEIQQNLQELLSKLQSMISNEIDFCPGLIGTHGVKK